MNIKRALFTLALGLGLVLVLLLVLDGNLSHVRAATYTVSTTSASGPGSLFQAILDANVNPGHDTIDFAVTGTITLATLLPPIDDDLTIDGPGAGQLAISGANSNRIFTINSSTAVTITGVTVQDGSAGNGAGIWSAGNLHLDGVHVVGNSATLGGGVYVHQGSTTLSGTLVSGNSASDHGGGVYVEQGSATLNETQVVDNSASDDGGGVYVAVGSATLNETQVVDNLASDDGGGVYIEQGNATLSGTQVVGNWADNGGGVCIDVVSATLDMNGGVIDSNWANPVGGGVYVGQGSATLSGTQVVDNRAYALGGGVYVSQGSVTLNEAQVVGNSANDGGGVYVWSGRATLSGTHVCHNTASTYSGGPYGGGGLYLGSSGEITAVDGCILSNSDTAVHRQNGTLTATDNWWGAPDGPSGAGPGSGDSVSANVDYANYKTSAPAECLAYSTEWHIYLPLVVRND